MLSKTSTREVQWGDCDPAGIIFFPNYGRWIVENMIAMFRGVGIDPVGRCGEGLMRGVPTVSLALDFSAPARLHDIVEQKVWVQSVGKSSIKLEHEFRTGETLLASARQTIVWSTIAIEDAKLTAEPISDDLMALLCAR